MNSLTGLTRHQVHLAGRPFALITFVLMIAAIVLGFFSRRTKLGSVSFWVSFGLLVILVIGTKLNLILFPR